VVDFGESNVFRRDDSMPSEKPLFEEAQKYEMMPCTDCGRAWFMSEQEYAWWQKKVEEEGFTMPKRCKSCRDNKRRAGGKSPSLEQSPSSSLFDLLQKIESGELNDLDVIMYNLKNIARAMKALEAKLQGDHAADSAFRSGTTESRRVRKI